MNFYLDKDTKRLTKREMRILGEIPAIRGYVKEGYPKLKNDGYGSIPLRCAGPIEDSFETREIDVYEEPNGMIIGYAALSDNTFVGIVRPKEKIIMIGASCAVAAAGLVLLGTVLKKRKGR